MAQHTIDGDVFTCDPQLEAQYVSTSRWGSSNGDYKVYCKTLMPEISMAVARSLSPVALSKTMFCNASDCAISPMSRVTPINYITAKSVPNAVFSDVHMDYGSTIIIQSFNHDFANPILTTIKDPSTYHKYG